MNRPLRRANTSTVERSGLMLGRAIASMCAMVDVDSVFVSGSVIDTFGDVLLDIARKELRTRSRLSNLDNLTVIEPVEHLSPLVRAAALADRGSIGTDPA